MFKYCGPKAAISSIVAGIVTFIITKDMNLNSLALEVSLPTIVAAIVFVLFGLATKIEPPQVKNLLASLKEPT